MMQYNQKKLTESTLKNSAILLAVLVFVYVILFEFILPYNKIFPKPSILWESFISLWDTYTLLSSLLLTLSVVYTSLLVGYIVIHLKSYFVIKMYSEYTGPIVVPDFLKFFTVIFFAVLFNLWFPESSVAEFVFGIITCALLIYSVFNKEFNRLKQEYIDSALSLGVSKNIVYRKVIYKAMQPGLVKSLISTHLKLWTVVIIYEFIGGYEGIGLIYRTTFEYNDLAAVAALGIFIAIIISLMNFLLKTAINKSIFWEA